jgi:hypothetical protein
MEKECTVNHNNYTIKDMTQGPVMSDLEAIQTAAFISLGNSIQLFLGAIVLYGLDVLHQTALYILAVSVFWTAFIAVGFGMYLREYLLRPTTSVTFPLAVTNFVIMVMIFAGQLTTLIRLIILFQSSLQDSNNNVGGLPKNQTNTALKTSFHHQRRKRQDS